MLNILIIYILSLLIKCCICKDEYIYETKYFMEDIEKLSIVKCKTNSDCPDYSNGCYIPKVNEEGVCNLFLNCHKGEKCFVLNEKEYEEDIYYEYHTYPPLDNVKLYRYSYYNITYEEKKKSLIAQCNRNDIKNHLCETEFCFRHNDCYSNKCYLGICETNVNNKLYICSLLSDEKKLEGELSYNIKCLLAKQEDCINDKECFKGKCDSKSHLCVDGEVEENYFKGKDKNEIIGLPSVLFFILLLIFITVLFGICCCRKSRNNPQRIRID